MLCFVSEPSVCSLPQAIGNCYQFRERWYYNSFERKCQRFYYSGCGGNENNFASYLECEKQCEKSFDQHSTEEFSIGLFYVFPAVYYNRFKKLNRKYIYILMLFTHVIHKISNYSSLFYRIL